MVVEMGFNIDDIKVVNNLLISVECTIDSLNEINEKEMTERDIKRMNNMLSAKEFLNRIFYVLYNQKIMTDGLEYSCAELCRDDFIMRRNSYKEHSSVQLDNLIKKILEDKEYLPIKISLDKGQPNN